MGRPAGSSDTRLAALHSFTLEELNKLLRDSSSKSASGVSRISWAVLKLAWDDVKDHATMFASSCLAKGYHPKAWQKALVVVILKPDRPDHALVKNYRPISLIECLSKLIEKGVSKRLLYDIGKHSLIRFPRVAGSCTLGMYVDDGVIFTEGPDWGTVTTNLRD